MGKSVLGALAILSAVSKSMGSLAFNKLGPGYFEIKGQNHQNKPADTAKGLFWFVGEKESFPPFFFDVWWRQCYLDITRPFDCLQPAPTPISPHVSVVNIQSLVSLFLFTNFNSRNSL